MKREQFSLQQKNILSAEEPSTTEEQLNEGCVEVVFQLIGKDSLSFQGDIWLPVGDRTVTGQIANVQHFVSLAQIQS